MVIRGTCTCKNIHILWRNSDFSLVPRKCGCDYCSHKSAAYVAKSGTAVEITIRNPGLVQIRQHGARLAKFHECSNCGDLVVVTATIEGELFCAINVNCLDQRNRFSNARDVNFSEQSPGEKRERWKMNWCQPVTVTSPGAAEAI